MSKLIALVATAVVVGGVRTVIQPGEPLPELSKHDERELLQSGAAENPADTAALAKEAEVEEMWLTHYSPSLTKPQYYIDEVRRIFPRAKAGNDGMTAELMFED